MTISILGLIAESVAQEERNKIAE